MSGRRCESRRAFLVASHGGHWVQLRRLAPAFEGMDVWYVTTTAKVREEVASAPVLIVPDANLNEKLRLLLLAGRMLWLTLRYRPRVVMSTGAAPGFFALMFGKLIGARTIWVDSLANAERMSVSGAKVRPFADLWLTQWPEVASPFGPFYKGAVI